MRAYEAQLIKRGFTVAYVETAKAATSMQQVSELLKKQDIQSIVYFDVVDDWLERSTQSLIKSLGATHERLESPSFLTSAGQVERYFSEQAYSMQNFYVWQRKRLKILVDSNGNPVGGKWSFDELNRKKLPKNVTIPETYRVNTNSFIESAKDWVQAEFPENPGSIDTFNYVISHEEAEERLSSFLQNRLHDFGQYEDAIDSNNHSLFHSELSAALNIGLLTPNQIIDAVVRYADDNPVPLQSTEGFVRQIIGWREYMRATYVREGRSMRTQNHLRFNKKIPKSWWTAQVGLKPVDTVIESVLDSAYAHHIERLMVLGNAMMLLRFDPDEVYEWFMSLFIDAYDWVMVPNVYAMSQFAAGELITTKPYISGSNYILKMSNFKKDAWSADWDALYWTFIRDHKDMMASNYRSKMVVTLYEKMSDEKKATHSENAKKWLD